MKTNLAAFICIVFGGLLVTLVACDTAPKPPSSSATLNEPGSELHSRVFDGRDSLTTGAGGPTATKDNFAIVTQFLEVEGDDVGRIGITDPDALDASTPLFESRTGASILTPDDEQVTWGQFSGAEGAIIVKCTKKGTHTTVHLSGLIPKGVYSVWNVLGSLGPAVDYTEMDSKNSLREPTSFRASGRGEGHISGLTLPDDDVGACLLDDVETGQIWHIVAIYHIDGTPDLDDEGTFIEQVGFTFGEAPPPVVQ